MSAPLVVNTTDGTVWTRREGTRDGEALYAPEKCGRCPEFVMATYAELEGHGVAGSADALPMPVGSYQAELDRALDDLDGANLARWEEERENARLRLALKSAKRGRRELRFSLGFAEPSRDRWRSAAIEAEKERDALRARVAELEAAPRVHYRAGFRGADISLGHYTNPAAARKHCEAFARREGLTADLNWVLDEPDDESSVEELVAGGEPTGYIVTPVEVASEYDEEADE